MEFQHAKERNPAFIGGLMEELMTLTRSVLGSSLCWRAAVQEGYQENGNTDFVNENILFLDFFIKADISFEQINTVLL